MVLEAWRASEADGGGAAAVAAVEKKLPRRVKKRRPVYGADGTAAGQEEYYDYIFPDDAGAAGANLKILQAAYAWKAKLALAEGGGDKGGDGDGGDGDGGEEGADGEGEGEEDA